MNADALDKAVEAAVDVMATDDNERPFWRDELRPLVEAAAPHIAAAAWDEGYEAGYDDCYDGTGGPNPYAGEGS